LTTPQPTTLTNLVSTRSVAMIDLHAYPPSSGGCALISALLIPWPQITYLSRGRRECSVAFIHQIAEKGCSRKRGFRHYSFLKTQEMKADKKRARESSPQPSFARLSPQEEWAFSQVLDPPLQNIGTQEYTQGQHSHPRPNWPSLCTTDPAVRGYNTTSNSSHTTIALRIRTTLSAKVRTAAAQAPGH
jgi:hypothetical protein